MSIIAFSSISALIARNLLYPEVIIKTITNISSNLISSVHYLTSISHKDKDLQKLLIVTDIAQDIIIIKSFIEENKFNNNSTTIIACINNLNETLSELELNINSITKKIQDHNNSVRHKKVKRTELDNSHLKAKMSKMTPREKYEYFQQLKKEKNSVSLFFFLNLSG